MKIYVYAICKNEEKNIPLWFESMKEADGIYVLDTGSTDKSVSILKKLGVKVKRKIINPWRFDNARNESFKLTPKDGDLYICTDIDERFEKGWREILEKNYRKEYSRVKYLYNWSFDKYGNPATVFYLDKIHNKDYYWKNPVHEVLATKDEENIQYIEGIVLNHYQDYKKNRSSYLKLLELSVKENPEDDRNMHYLGREYMYYKKYYKCIDTLHKHLKLKSATWKDERCASMRYIARCYNSLGFNEETKLWYKLAIDEAPYLRESYVELAFLEYSNFNYLGAYKLLNKAFKIKDKSFSYINESFAWDAFIYELYGLVCFYLNKKDIALRNIKKAISLNPDDKRLYNNYSFIKTACTTNLSAE